MTLLDALTDELRKAGRYNRNDQVEPAALLWTDPARRFEALVPHLRGALPVLTLGAYRPEQLTGPAIWIRCALANTLPGLTLPAGVPIVYLPGVQKAQLRAVQECPEDLKPLAELQYRGALFIHENGRDWTPAALLSQQGVKVAADGPSQDALAQALVRLAQSPLTELRRHAVLNAAVIHALLTPDLVGTLLNWLAAPDATRAQLEQEGNWSAFTEQCKAQYGFHPDKDGPLSAARLLGAQQGVWKAVWARFARAPRLYAGLAGQLRQARPPGMLTPNPESWPQDNEEDEARLRRELCALAGRPAEEARAELLELARAHGGRRGSVWAELGQAALARALEPLVTLARQTAAPLGHGLPCELATRYFDEHWRTDAAALDALARVGSNADLEAVQAALTAVYCPWLEEGAKAFQAAVMAQDLPFPTIPRPEPGTCIMFTDGLRLDLAQRLAERLEAAGHAVERAWTFGALPGVTPTAKPAISPLAEAFSPDATGFDVRFKGSRLTAALLRKALAEAGLSVITDGDSGDPTKGGWTEYGNLDSTGHSQGLKLARYAGDLVAELAERVAQLLGGGWREVKFVTDHGWLLVPGGLPKRELPQHLTETRKGRCARLKPDSSVTAQTVPWRFDAQVCVAVADGISAFEEGKVYEHGGLSVQECVLPVFSVRRGGDAGEVAVTLREVRWRGLRCEILAEGGSGGETVELRLKPADANSTVAGPKALGQSLPVADDALEGRAVFAVVLSPDGHVLAQLETLVGGA